LSDTNQKHKSKQKTYSVLLNSAQNVHTTCDTDASGSAIVTLTPMTNTSTVKTLCIYLSYSGLSTDVELYSHIHGPAAIGANAAVLFTLSPTPVKRDCFDLNSNQTQYLYDGLLYINVHTNTTGCTAGEIRGQILGGESYHY
jgi:GH43 family beta-xylosidase